MKIKLITTSLALLLFASGLLAQGGSVYTRQGVGDNIYANSARRTGLGGLGFAAEDHGYISSLNPAGWYPLQLTRFEVGLKYNGILLSDAYDSKYYSNYSFSGFSIGIPIQRDYGLVASLGILPVTDVNYNVKITNSFSSPFDFQSSEEFSNFHYQGEGGLSKFYLGMSYKLPNDFVIGATYEYLTGKIDYNSTLEFIEGSTYTNVEYIQKRSYHGSGTSIGIISNDFSYLFNSDNINNFKVAAFLNYIGGLSTDTTLTAVTSIGTIVKNKGIVSTKIPYKLGLGASLTWNKKYLILIDYLYQPWSKYSFDGKETSSLKDLQKASFTVEYSDPDSRFSQSIWDEMVYRWGLGYEQTQYEFNGQSINKFSVHGGVSFPLGTGNTIDIGLEYGLRGSTDSGLLKENIFKANISLSFGELWFVRQER